MQQIDAIDGLGQDLLERLEACAAPGTGFGNPEDELLGFVDDLGRSTPVGIECGAADLVACADQ